MRVIQVFNSIYELITLFYIDKGSICKMAYTDMQ
jgi:hypothetical protein